MGKTIDPRKIWEEYQRGVEYNTAIDLYETVRRNENFFIGKQWEGVNAPDLPKPTMNFLKRVVSYFVAMLASDDISVSLTPFMPDAQKQQLLDLAADEIEAIFEADKTKSKNRILLRNAAVDGDACLYVWFDPDAETGQEAAGRIRTEVVENINVLFANPYSDDLQSQRSIIIVQRKTLEDVKEEAKANGGDPDSIKPDQDEHQGEKNESNSLCTVCIRLWKKDGTVWAQKSTQEAIIRKAWDTGYKLYPLAYWSWDKVRSSYHGQACITGLIPNQIAVNKLYAMAVRSVELNAFPKVIYDSTKIKRWDNTVGQAIPVVGDITQAAMTSFRVQDMSHQVMDCVDRTVSMTRDFMGASDAALGNVKPDNTSAIIAVQQASAVPLELQQMAFYQFVEDYIRVMLELMRVHYGIRQVVTGETIDPMTGAPVAEVVQVDYSILDDPSLTLNVDIGPSSYWSESMQVQTLDNLFAAQVIDKLTYVKSIPDKYVPNKAEIIESIEQTMAQEQAAAQAAMMNTPTTPPNPMMGGEFI